MFALKNFFRPLIWSVLIVFFIFLYWKIHSSVISPQAVGTSLFEEVAAPIASTTLSRSEEVFRDAALSVTNFRLSPTSSQFLTIVKMASSTSDLQYSEIPHFVSDWAGPSSTVVINGGYFDEDNSPSGFLVSQGQRVGTRMFDQEKSGLITMQKGNITIRDLDTHPIQKNETFDFALQSYPFLLKHGAGAIAQDSGLKARRTALGIDESGSVYVLFVQSSSLSLYEFMNVLLQTKIPFQDVLNLDGGPSSGLLIRSGEYEKVYNSLTPVPSVLSFSGE